MNTEGNTNEQDSYSGISFTIVRFCFYGSLFSKSYFIWVGCYNSAKANGYVIRNITNIGDIMLSLHILSLLPFPSNKGVTAITG